MTYYHRLNAVAEIELEIMGVVRIKIAWRTEFS